jgi:hypothetical protein
MLAVSTLQVNERGGRFWFDLLLIDTSPLTPLQPVFPGMPEDFLAGEGSVIERGLCLLQNPSLISPVSSTGQALLQRETSIPQNGAFKRGADPSF